MRSLPARGPFDFLYFTRISLFSAEIIFYLAVDVVVGVDDGLVLSLKLFIMR